MTETVAAVNPYEALITSGMDTLRSESAAYNVLAERIVHADNAVRLVHEYRDDAETEDPNIVAFRDFKEKLLANLAAAETKIETYIVDNKLVDTTPIDVAAATEQAKAKAKLVKELKTVLSNFPGGTEALSELPELTKLPGVRAGGSTGAGGTGIKRPRLTSITVDGVNIEKDGKSTTGILAAHLTKAEYVTATGGEITTSFLQEHLYAAAGVSDLSTLKGRPIEFSLAVKKGEAEETLSIVAVPSVPEK